MSLLTALLVLLSSPAAHPVAPAVTPAAAIHSVTEDDAVLQRRPGEPFAGVRAMRAAQDALAAGTIDRQAYGDVDRRTREMLLAATSDDLKLDRNRYAVISFALRGGEPSVVRRLLDDAALDGFETALAGGALAYAEGRLDAARSSLLELDPLRIPEPVGAPLSLVQAILQIGLSDGRALELLDVTRLLAPGTLLEESALRRQAFVAMRVGDDDRSAHAVARWLSRFPNSPFQPAFAEQYILTLADMPQDRADRALYALAKRFAEYRPAARVRFNLDIARRALAERRLDLARTAARVAEGLAPDPSGELMRARLYAAASDAATPRAGRALDRLRALQNVDFEANDKAILASALSVASQLASLDLPEEGTAPQVADRTNWIGEIRERARRSIAAASERLGAAPQ